MSLQITLQGPENYLTRIEAGCIIDPSVFYSEYYVEAATIVLSSITPMPVYIPSNLLDTIEKADWSSFLSTLTLWSGNYEKLPDSWNKRSLLMEEVMPTPIEISGKEERVDSIYKAMSKEGELSPLDRILFEMTACSILNEIPVLVGSHSKIRFLELLSSKLQTIIVEPLGEWARAKKEFLTKKKSRAVVVALSIMGGAFVFITLPEIIPITGIGPAATITATIIDGS